MTTRVVAASEFSHRGWLGVIRMHTRKTLAWNGRHNRRHQQGQALIYGIFILVGGLAALFFLFNTGQLSREKTKLVDTADAVAYSAGVMHARTLNYLAYTNRAMVANTVAIAQLVSLSSWIRYVDTTAEWGATLANPAKYPAFFSSYWMMHAERERLNAQFIEGGRLENLAKRSDENISDVLGQAQNIAYTSMASSRQTVMDDVAKANYLDGADGIVSVDIMPASTRAFEEFVQLHTDEQRTRFAEVAQAAAKLDRFQESRSWQLLGLYSECGDAPPDWIERRGGTELVGLDEWKAMDTIAEHVWRRIKFSPCIFLRERPAGWGGQSAAQNPAVDLDPRHYDRSPAFNPATSAIASATSHSWGYSGIPRFYDLTDSQRDKDQPELSFAIRVRRAISQTATSEGRSIINNTPRLNAYHAQPAGGNELVAVSAAQVFFRRPDVGDHTCSDGRLMGRDNCYGRAEIGRGSEIGSLFNPYWQVRLVHDEDGVRQARAMQGVSLP
jgi:hypothetical protein